MRSLRSIHAACDPLRAPDEVGPGCGRPRAAGDGEKPAAPQDATVHQGPPDAATESDAVETALIADLREALGFQPDASQAGPAEQAAASVVLDPDTLPAGTRLADFKILGELGRGGMGIVYRARQISLGREVALKVLPRYARHGRVAVQRFRAEAQAAARLHHTNVVSIYAQGECEGQFYYAMELVDGVGLDTVIRSRPDLLSSTRARGGSSAGWGLASGTRIDTDRGPARPAADIEAPRPPNWTREDYRHLARLLAEVADALDCAHRNNVIHRDVKPHNLLLGQNNRLHLTDFGLARLTDEPHLTISGEIMGTPAYLSPEQVRGDAGKIDHRTDIYSLGVTLFELLTRRKPFAGETREQIISGIRTTEPTPPRRIDRRIPIDLETICLRAMEKSPARRHPTAALLAEDLRRFAEGRPILSRRITPLAKAAKWVRRHQALTAALVSIGLAVVLGGGLILSVRSARQQEGQRLQQEGQRLLRDAYEHLAYFDYRTPELVTADIERAAELGADPLELHLVRALAGAGTPYLSEAKAHLEAVREADPDDLRAWYLLAWMQRREHESAAAWATFEQAEQRGPPRSADAWFFRGLAMHFDDPQTAIESYRQANALRARESSFYPQAVLHLARARNQQLYATRSLDGLPEIADSLEQLIRHEHYAAYPHYLLSIAHRLAAEIYQGSRGTRDDSLVQQHYAQALEWARLGQKVDPADDRPVTAEAECLESRGLWEEALAARTRAIALATGEYQRWEGYHFRWRLHYWLGDLDAALDDLAVLREYDPQCPFYEHIYPALVYAEQGDLPTALSHARARAEQAPDNAQAVLWSATCLRLLGQPGEAADLLESHATMVDCTAELIPPQSEAWVRALYEHCQSGGPLTELDALADEVAQPWRLWGEGHFHAAARRLSGGDREGALAGFGRAYRAFDNERRYTYHAKLIYHKMQQDPAWPPWISLSWKQELDKQRDWDLEPSAGPRLRGQGED